VGERKSTPAPRGASSRASRAAARPPIRRRPLTRPPAPQAAEPAECRDYFSTGATVATSVDAVTDTISVADAFALGDVVVTLDVGHRRVGALVAMLTGRQAGTSPQARMVVLKSRGLGSLGSDLKMTSFADGATANFPEAAERAPFSGTFRPAQRLSFLAEAPYSGSGFAETQAGAGGSRGDWVLHLNDVSPGAADRPIALSGWMLRLCPRTPGVAVPAPVAPVQPVPLASPSPSQWTAQGSPASPSPAPAPAPAPPPIDAFSGAGAGAAAVPRRIGAVFGWPITMEAAPSGYVAPAFAQGAAPGGMPSYATGLGGAGALLAKASSFGANFDAYLSGRFGEQCADARCSNVKAKFWRAAAAVAYARAVKSGKVEPGALVERIIALVPGPDGLKSRLGTMTAEQRAAWTAKRAVWRDQLFAWGSQLWDRVNEMTAGDSEGLQALMSSALSGGGGGLLGLDATALASSLGPMLGLDNAADMQALMEGLQEAGFGDMMAEFLRPS
jgi:hypothetical protein